MKKTLLFVLLIFCVYAHAQSSDYYNVLPTDGSSSSNGRAPQGNQSYNRAVWLITASEMASGGFTSGSIVNSLGFNFISGLNVPVTSTFFRIYLQNTTATSNTKSTDWATAITGMTTVNTANVTLPSTAGIFHFPFSGGSTFTYSGGALYIAFDYQNVGAISGANSVAATETSLANGIKSITSLNFQAPPPTTLNANSAFRPQTFLGKSVNCARPHFLGFNNPTSTTANVTWSTNGPTGDGYNIQYGLDGYTFNVNPLNYISGQAMATSQVITGLTPGTVYQYYIQKDCDITVPILSAYSGPYPFYTTFPNANLPYITSFETYTPDYMGWKADPEVNGSDWFIYKDPGNPLIQDSASALLSLNNTTAASQSRVCSRGINLTGGQQVTINFYLVNIASTNPTSSGGHGYELRVSTSANASAPFTLIDFGSSDNDYNVNTLQTFTYTPPSTGTYYFSFIHNATIEPAPGAFKGFLLDNFKVRLTSTLANETQETEQFSLVPNPANDIVRVFNSNNDFIKKIYVTDLNGRIVKQVTFENVSDVVVNISDLTIGLYMMSIESNKGSFIKKIVKN